MDVDSSCAHWARVDQGRGGDLTQHSVDLGRVELSVLIGVRRFEVSAWSEPESEFNGIEPPVLPEVAFRQNRGRRWRGKHWGSMDLGIGGRRLRGQCRLRFGAWIWSGRRGG